eukprot:206307-Chlamydomonas_euryale.AAC.6
MQERRPHTPPRRAHGDSPRVRGRNRRTRGPGVPQSRSLPARFDRPAAWDKLPPPMPPGFAVAGADGPPAAAPPASSPPRAVDGQAPARDWHWQGHGPLRRQAALQREDEPRRNQVWAIKAMRMQILRGARHACNGDGWAWEGTLRSPLSRTCCAEYGVGTERCAYVQVQHHGSYSTMDAGKRLCAGPRW